MSWWLLCPRVANWAVVPWSAQAPGGCDPGCPPFQLEEPFHNSCGVNRKSYWADLNPCHGLNTSGNEELSLAKQPSACAAGESLSNQRWGQCCLKERAVLCPPLPSCTLPATGAASLLEAQASQDGKLILAEINKGFLLGRQVEPVNGRPGKCQGPSKEGGSQREGTGVVTPCRFGGSELADQVGSS